MSERISPFRKLVYKLSRELTSENVVEIKYLAKLGVAEQCKTALDVFQELERVGKIAPDKLEYLKEELFDTMERRDLIGNFSIFHPA